MTADSIFTLSTTTFFSLFKFGIIAFSALYFIFSLIVVRQVALMTETVLSEMSSLLRALSLLHAGVSLAIVVLLVLYI